MLHSFFHLIVHNDEQEPSTCLLEFSFQSETDLPVHEPGTGTGYPDRLQSRWDSFDPLDACELQFFPPDPEKFPAIRLAFEAMAAGGTMPAVLNAANEEAVSLFLHKRIGFTSITALIEQAMHAHTVVASPLLDDLLAADHWARSFITEQHLIPT